MEDHKGLLIDSFSTSAKIANPVLEVEGKFRQVGHAHVDKVTIRATDIRLEFLLELVRECEVAQ